MNGWGWWLLGVISAPAIVVVAWLIAWAVSPGRGWTLSCTFGHHPFSLPQYGPRCDWSVSAARRFPPEWTKHIRFRWHWLRTHPNGRRYLRDVRAAHEQRQANR